MSDDSAGKMKNLTTKDFCRNFGACEDGSRFASQYKTMRECYAALLRGEAGGNSTAWAIWAATRNGVMPERDLRLFAVRCARRVQYLMSDDRALHAIDVAERYANGYATAEELAAEAYAAAEYAVVAGWAAARPAADDAARSAAWWAEHATAYAVAKSAADAAWRAADAAERAAQLRILAEFGNPFEEEEAE